MVAPRCIQPGGGAIFRCELAWGRCRRWLLKRFWPRYVAEMAAKRRGKLNPCPFEVLDPRDLKYFVHPESWYWHPDDDPFRWRERLPFVRDGLAELVLLSGLTLSSVATLAALATLVPGIGGTLGLVIAILGLVPLGLIPWFFRNPRRRIPAGDLWLSPADGRITSIDEFEEHPVIGGPALRISIFLSLFNVHINRVPRAGRVTGVVYRPGKFLNAMSGASSVQNEAIDSTFVSAADGRPFLLRQIAGLVASRIVCRMYPGRAVQPGEYLGMIKFGSRTELIIPLEDGLEIYVSRGDKVKAGTTVLAKSPAE